MIRGLAAAFILAVPVSARAEDAKKPKLTHPPVRLPRIYAGKKDLDDDPARTVVTLNSQGQIFMRGRPLVHASVDSPLPDEAISLSQLKQVELSLKSLERALKLGYRDISHMIKDDDLRNVRRDPRFRKLVEKRWGRRQSRRKKK